MQNPPETISTNPANSEGMVRAIRFALVCVLCAISLLNICASAAIPHVKNVLAAILEGAALPWMTLLILRGHLIFALTSWLLAAGSIALLFFRPTPRSFYIVGFLALAMLLQIVFICAGISGASVHFFSQLGDSQSRPEERALGRSSSSPPTNSPPSPPAVAPTSSNPTSPPAEIKIAPAP